MGPENRFYTVNDRPVALLATPEGGQQAYAYDYASAQLRADPAMFERISDVGGDVQSLSRADWGSALADLLSEATVRWNGTDDGEYPYRYEMGSLSWRIRIGDFPEEALYHLVLDGPASTDQAIEVLSLDDWPASWAKPVSEYAPDSAQNPRSVSAEAERAHISIAGIGGATGTGGAGTPDKRPRHRLLRSLHTGKIMRAVQEHYADPGETVLACAVVVPRGFTQRGAGVRALGATQMRDMAQAATRAGVTLATPTGLVVTDRRLLFVKLSTAWGLGIGGTPQQVLSDVPLSEVDAIETHHLLLGTTLQLTVRGETFGLEANALADTFGVRNELRWAKSQLNQ